jgi:hypothetical protein
MLWPIIRNPPVHVPPSLVTTCQLQPVSRKAERNTISLLPHASKKTFRTGLPGKPVRANLLTMVWSDYIWPRSAYYLITTGVAVRPISAIETIEISAILLTSRIGAASGYDGQPDCTPPKARGRNDFPRCTIYHSRSSASCSATNLASRIACPNSDHPAAQAKW